MACLSHFYFCIALAILHLVVKHNSLTNGEEGNIMNLCGTKWRKVGTSGYLIQTECSLANTP
jgi:hypothetical protein